MLALKNAFRLNNQGHYLLSLFSARKVCQLGGYSVVIRSSSDPLTQLGLQINQSGSRGVTNIG